MITLKTLPQATAQEVFDQAAKHLLTQGKKAIKGTGSCCYRVGNLKCAAGCFIADDEYRQEFEGHLWTSDIFPNEHRYLIASLQEIHDLKSVESWEKELQKLAEREHLIFSL